MKPGLFYSLLLIGSILLSIFVSGYFYIATIIFLIIIFMSIITDKSTFKETGDSLLLGFTLMFYKSKRIYYLDKKNIFAIYFNRKIYLFTNCLFFCDFISSVSIDGYKETIEICLRNYFASYEKELKKIKKIKLEKDDFYKGWDGFLTKADSRDIKLKKLIKD